MWMATEIKFDGTIYSLSDGDPYYRVSSQGTSQGPRTRYTQRGPQQVGESDVGFTLLPRDILHVIEFSASTGAQMETRVAELERLLAPTSAAFSLRYTKRGGLIYRQIDCHVATYDLRAIGPLMARASIAFHCPDPLFYHPSAQTATWSPSGSGWDIPMSVPWDIGSGALDSTQAIQYEGDWEEAPSFAVTGPITDLVITNDTTGKTIDLTGSTIPQGETWTITTAYASAAVTDADGDTRNDVLASGHDLAEWRLTWDKADRIDLGYTSNGITVTGRNTNEQTQIVMTYYYRYQSVFS